MMDLGSGTLVSIGVAIVAAVITWIIGWRRSRAEKRERAEVAAAAEVNAKSLLAGLEEPGDRDQATRRGG